MLLQLSTMSELSKIRKQNSKIKQQLRLSPYFKYLNKRKYRKVKGYSSWEEICLDITSYCEIVDTYTHTSLDHTSKLIALLGYQLQNSFCPVYWVKKELVEALIKTELPDNLLQEELEVAPYLIFNLPLSFIKDDRECSINWIGVNFIKTRESTKYTTKTGNTLGILKNDTDKLSWVAMSDLMVGYSSTKNLPLTKESLEEPEAYSNDKFSLTAGILSGNDMELTKLITKVVVQLLLIIKNRPDFISEDIPSIPTSTRVKDRLQREKLLNPIWLGNNYKVHTRKATSSELSKRTLNPNNYPYWVTGHWRRVVIGKRSEGNRIRKFIAPYKVYRPLKEI